MKLDEYLTAISNTEVYSVDDIANKIGLDVDKVIKISKFFSRYQFVTYDEEKELVRVDPRVKVLFS